MLRSVFDYSNKKLELDSLNLEMNSNVNFWENVENAQKVTKRVSFLDRLLKSLDNLSRDYNELMEMIEFVFEDESFFNDLKETYYALVSNIEQFKIQALLCGEYDNNKAILTITSGAGGTEAQDWVQMLFRMYSMYAEKMNFKLEVIDLQDGDVAGIKTVTFSLDGPYAYGYLKCEMGVHRLVRISPFDSGARRHTSFASVEVVPEIEETCDVEVRDEDIRLDTYRASGAGGQHINKTDSAVRITHFPTGIVVTCQNERSQIQNREKAMRVLKSKLLQLKIEDENKKLQQMKGEVKKIEWGSQIRSYVFCPYTLVKDHRTNVEVTNVENVLDGDIDVFINSSLKEG